MSAANDSQPILPWKDVRDSQTFQEADWTKRQKIRGNYARKVIDPRISDSKENRKARDAFFNATEEDVFGKRDEDSGRTSLGDSESLNYGYPGGLSDKQALADRRDASQDLDVPEPEGDDSGSTAVGLMRSGAAGLPASFGATAGGAGRIIQQSDINLANRRVDSAERSLRNIKETMGRALEGAPEGDRDSIRERYAPEIEKHEQRVSDALEKWAERDPNKLAAWLEERGVDLKKTAEDWDVDPDDRTWVNDVAGGIGSMVSYLGPGVVAKLATRGSALAGGAAAVGMAAPAGVSESYDRAIDAGLDEGEALEKSMQGALPGAIQVAPLASILKPLPKNLQKKAVGQLYGVLRTGGQEASVEGAGAVLQNLIEQSYNPEQGTWDDAAYRAAIGGASGGAVQGVTQALTRGRGMGADKESEGEPTVEDAAEQVDAGPEPAAPEGESTSAPTGAEQGSQGAVDAEGAQPQEGVDSTEQRARTSAPRAGEDSGSRLIRANPDQLQPAERQARERLLSGDGYSMLRERAEEAGKLDAVDAIDRMQASSNEGDAAGAADAYLEARHILSEKGGDSSPQAAGAESEPGLQGMTREYGGGNEAWRQAWQDRGVENPEQGLGDTTTTVNGESATPAAGLDMSDTTASVDQAASETDINPTPAQAEAGNYRKGRVRINGFDIAIENPRGSTRRGTAPDGAAWESTMAHHYGDIKGTTASDGDNLDVFVGENPDASSAFVVDQVNEDGSFDEVKIMLGFDSMGDAQKGYLDNYEDGWQGMGDVTEVPTGELKEWVDKGDTKKPFSAPGSLGLAMPGESTPQPAKESGAAGQASQEPAGDLLGDTPSNAPTDGRLTPQRVPVDQIEVDPDAYQFRTEVDKAGVDSRLEGVEKWDDLRAGNLILHERSNGQVFAADGHHRINLAKKLNQPDVNAYVLREDDGYSVEDARRLAAETNIAAGNASATDAAKVFRNIEGKPEDVIRERNLPSRSQVVRDGADIAKLGDVAFGSVLNKVVSEKDGAVIGRSFDDSDQQLAAVDVFQKVKPENENQRALLVNEVRQAGFAEAQGDQGGLFGDDPAASLIGERVRVMDRLRQELVRDKRLFATLNTNAKTAELAGNRIATGQNEALQDASASAISLLERATTTPEINQQINDAARRVNDGEKVSTVARELKETLLNGTNEQAKQSDRSPSGGVKPAKGRGEVERGGRPEPVEVNARAAGSGESRVGGEQGAQQDVAQSATESDGVTMKASGQPFQTKRSAELSKRFRDSPGAQAVEVDGGWGFTVAEQDTGATDRKAKASAADARGAAESGAPVIVENTPESLNTWMQSGDRVGRQRGWDVFVEDDGSSTLMTPYDHVGRFASEDDARAWARSYPGKRSGFLRVDGEKASDGFTPKPAPAVKAPNDTAQTQPESQGAQDDAPLLESYTEGDIAAREKASQQAEQDQAAQRLQDEQRAQADAEVGDFSLTGSNRSADVAASMGQDDLLGASSGQNDMLGVQGAEQGSGRQPASTTSPEFKQWFGDSQVVSEDGTPKVMYHGTIDDFSEFKASRQSGGLLFFTGEPDVANAYAQGDRSGYANMGDAEVRTGLKFLARDNKEHFDGKRMLPVADRDTLSRMLFDSDVGEVESIGERFDERGISAEQAVSEYNEFAATLGGPGSVMPVYLRAERPINSPDSPMQWKRAEQLGAEGLQDQGYDSVYITEVGTVALAVLDPKQVKSAFNEGGYSRDSADIRYSVSGSEGSPRLAATHNISAEGLAFADKMGGLSVPSIGVVTEDAGGVDGFGEVTLIGRRGLADPSREAVFSSDAYTARFPSPDYAGYSQGDLRRIRDSLEPYADRFDSQGMLNNLREHGVDSPDAGMMVSRALNSPAVMAMYLDSQGVQADPVMQSSENDPGMQEARELSGMGWTSETVADAYISNMMGEGSEQYRQLSEDYVRTKGEIQVRRLLDGKPEATEANIERVRKRHEGLARRSSLDPDGLLTEQAVGETSKAIDSLDRQSTEKVDYLATKDALQEKITDEPGFKQWVESTFVSPMGEPRVKVRGKLKPYTLDNIVESMTSSSSIASQEDTLTYSAGQARAATAEQFQTLDRMREAAAEKVRNPAEYEQAKNSADQLLDEYRSGVSGFTNAKNYRGEPDAFEGMDGAMRAVARYLGYKRRGRSAFERALKTEDFDVAAIKEAKTDDVSVEVDDRLVRSIRTDLIRWEGRLRGLDAGDSRIPTIEGKIRDLRKDLAEAESPADIAASDIVAMGMEAAEALEISPVPYFEAKPQRAVSLDEFAGAVVPENASQTTIQTLEKNGLPYRRAGEDQRAETISQLRRELSNRGEDVLFRRAQGGRAEVSATILREAIRRTPELSSVEVVQTTSRLPAKSLDSMAVQGISGSDVRGVYVGGKTYVVADNVSSVEEGIKVAVHEAVGHKGVREVLGGRLAPAMNQLYLSFPKSHQAWKDVSDAYSHIDTSTREGRLEFSEELVAHLAETNPQVSAWQRFVSQVRDLLRQMLPGIKWTEGDVLSLIARSRKSLADKARPDSGEVRFSLSRQQVDAGGAITESVEASLDTIKGIGRPTVVDSADNVPLNVALEATISGVNPQDAVAFYHGDNLYVVAENAENAAEATRATVTTVVGNKGLYDTVGGRVSPILSDVLKEARRSTAGRQAIRDILSEYDHITQTRGDQEALATELLARESSRSDPPSYIAEASRRLDDLVQEVYPNAGFSSGDGVGLAITSRHHLQEQQRDFGEKRPPYSLPFVFSANDGPGRGTLLDMDTQVVDANGDIISDAKVDSSSAAIAKGGLGLFESATDRLRRSRSPVLNELARRTDAFFDQSESRMGMVNGILRDPLGKMRSLNPRQRKRNMADFEQYMRHRDNGRADQAKEVADRNEAVAELAEAVDTMFDEVGHINQTVKTPQGTGMRVFDGKIGAYRKIGKIRKGNFWPRAIRPEVQKAMQDPTSNVKLWHELLDALIDEGRANSRKEAAEYLRGNNGYFSGEVANDYFAGIEKARGEKLPEMFYDYRFDVVTNYAQKWADRVSQVEQFGQKIGPNAKDSFEEAATVARDQATKEYIGWLADRVYSRRPTDAYHEAMSLANLAATGLQLGNPGTATLNILGGTQLNVQMFGSKRMAKAYAELARDYKNVQREGAEMGILGKDVLNILRDADNRKAEYMDASSKAQERLSKFSAFTMKWGGYTGTEQIIRATGMLAARGQLMDALNAWNNRPYSQDARKYRSFMERNRVDVAKLIRENGKGEETSRYLRLMVNIPQGSYRTDQTPLYVDSPMGRFFFKYQKFGTQVSRMFWQQKLKPFVDTVQDPSATGMDRARAFMPIMQWMAASAIGGGAVLAARSAMFGYTDPGPDLDEIAKAFEDDDTASAWGMLASKLHANLIAGSAYGFFGNYIQMGLDIADQQRVKNPFSPPGMAAVEAPVELFRRLQEQGTLHKEDWEQIATYNVAFYRNNKRGLLSLGNQAGFEADAVKKEQARRDIRYIRKAARRFADDAGIDAARTSTGRFGLTEHTAANREIVDAVTIGDGERAKQLVRETIQSADPGEGRKRRLQSIRSTVRARHPVQMGGPASKDEIAAFRRWSKKKLPASKLELVDEVIDRYEKAAWRAGL